MQDPSRKQQFTAMLDEHRARLRKVILTYGATREDREDLGQEILVQLWRSFASYDPQRPFATWMYRVALNVAIAHVRRARTRRPERSNLGGPVPDPPDPRTVTDRTVTDGGDDLDDRVRILRRLMADLDELDRALLLLHLEERSYREIADVLGLSESNVGTKLNRLRERLRQLAATELAREMAREMTR